jgi:type IV pilus assembly protein PilQ
MKTLPDTFCPCYQYRTCLQYMVIMCLLLYSGTLLHGQSTDPKYNSLDSLAIVIPALNTKVDITVSAAPVQEFLRGLANQTSINMNIDPSLSFNVSNNFNGVSVKDVLRFLTENYDVEIKGTGNILNIRKRNTEINPKTRVKIETKPGSDLVSLNISQVPIRVVSTEITKQTGQNIIVTPSLGESMVSCFILNMPLKAALEKMAIGNNFSIRKTADSVLIFEPVIAAVPLSQNATTTNTQKGSKNASGTPEIKLIGRDSIRINALNCRLDDIINKLFPLLNKPYNLTTALDDVVTLNYDVISFDALVQELFVGTSATFKVENGTYRIGKRNIIDMEEVLVVQLNTEQLILSHLLFPAS